MADVAGGEGLQGPGGGLIARAFLKVDPTPSTPVGGGTGLAQKLAHTAFFPAPGPQ